MPTRINERALTWVPEDQIEPQALAQIENISKMPFIFRHIAVMPDCHFGLGATVGSCIPTRRAVIPAAVGVDIGCGMIAERTQFTRENLPENLAGIRRAIEDRIPLSAGKYNQELTWTARNHVSQLEAKAEETGRLEFYEQRDRNWRRQLGSLGSGNHFIEIVLDEHDRVWTFLHSGSRGIGNKVAEFHIKTAKKLMEQYFIALPHPDLAYLVQDTREFRDYLTDLQWCQEFARLNRAEMSTRALDALAQETAPTIVQETVECHHNFSQWENHGGENIIVSRKGAIEAREGQMGLIPGSMGTRSYVVRGLGNRASFNTAPHGAGRRMSRGQARRTFTMEDFDREMAGVEVRRSDAFLDEMPGAYKDVDLVMEQSRDLVETVHTFRQIVNVKGD